MTIPPWMGRPARRPQTYQVPPSLENEQFSELPLYMLVAWWIFQRNIPATVRDVCEAFHISARRVGDIFLYLNSVDHIDCQRLWVPSPDGGRCRALSVSGLSLMSYPAKREPVTCDVREKQDVPRARRVRPSASESFRALRAWMVSRRFGESVPASFFPHLPSERGG